MNKTINSDYHELWIDEIHIHDANWIKLIIIKKILIQITDNNIILIMEIINNNIRNMDIYNNIFINE